MVPYIISSYIIKKRGNDMVRVCVCFQCKTYHVIHTHNFVSNKELENFRRKHKLHTIQIVNINELKPKNKFDPIYTKTD